MFKETYKIIGVMSGTSLDGIDLAHINFTIKDNKWRYQILESETISYSQDWLNKLKVAVSFSEENLIELNEDYTELLGKITKSFIDKHQLKNIDAVCSQ
jgi:anhydro-N-acetylmuramic acid kinase